MARKESLPVRAQKVSPAMLIDAQEAFLTNSLMGIMPLTFLDRRPIAKGKRGKWTRFFIDSYASLLSEKQ